MHITNLVAKELGLTQVKELEPFVTGNGVTIVDLEAAEGHFRVHLVRDSQYLNVKLEEGCKLAAYYNSMFWHEASTAEKISIPSGHFKTQFRVSDGDIKHSVFITESKGGSPRTKLGMAELEEVAREIAKLHAVNSKVVNEEFEEAVEENYKNIKSYRRKIQRELVDVFELGLTNSLSPHFSNPNSILKKVEILIHHLENLDADKDQEEKEKRVITHGNLRANTCKFNENGKLLEITEWENIHLGNPAEDLTNLIVTSAHPDIRKKKFLKVFQVYFYTLVDLQPPNYQLDDLKRWFREYQAKAVIDGIEPLLLTLAESTDGTLIHETAQRWEAYLNDAVDYITDNYISDDEHTFLSLKEGDED